MDYYTLYLWSWKYFRKPTLQTIPFSTSHMIWPLCAPLFVETAEEPIEQNQFSNNLASTIHSPKTNVNPIKGCPTDGYSLYTFDEQVVQDATKYSGVETGEFGHIVSRRNTNNPTSLTIYDTKRNWATNFPVFCIKYMLNDYRRDHDCLQTRFLIIIFCFVWYIPFIII